MVVDSVGTELEQMNRSTDTKRDIQRTIRGRMLASWWIQCRRSQSVESQPSGSTCPVISEEISQR